MYATIPLDPGNTVYHDGAPDYDDIKAHVGGWLEAIYLDKGVVMYLDEEGKVKGLQPNLLATVMARVSQAIQKTDWIAGPVVLTATGEQGAENALSDAQMAYIDQFYLVTP